MIESYKQCDPTLRGVQCHNELPWLLELLEGLVWVYHAMPAPFACLSQPSLQVVIVSNFSLCPSSPGACELCRGEIPSYPLKDPEPLSKRFTLSSITICWLNCISKVWNPHCFKIQYHILHIEFFLFLERIGEDFTERCWKIYISLAMKPFKDLILKLTLIF